MRQFVEIISKQSISAFVDELMLNDTFIASNLPTSVMEWSPT